MIIHMSITPLGYHETLDLGEETKVG